MILRAPGVEIPSTIATVAYIPEKGTIVGAPYISSDSLTDTGTGSKEMRTRRFIQRHPILLKK